LFRGGRWGYDSKKGQGPGEGRRVIQLFKRGEEVEGGEESWRGGIQEKKAPRLTTLKNRRGRNIKKKKNRTGSEKMQIKEKGVHGPFNTERRKQVAYNYRAGKGK